ncbi:FAD-dependent oxidoreductase [Aspergillus chevalieri]|uniref:FAD-binding domain-containing protein n=1 Tax=Aspergillus chevalieri TaxID=182096 RepID=A0A7R7VR52_ASPCH|nr:uncharacterized protein ACHE_50475S [Aspergillus chevalieri]BCR89277.1 hypothetical protein ACHE_50475S [Aspergillus chevalieri]
MSQLGYVGFFMERQRVLEVLYNSIVDKSRLHTLKRVTAVRSTDAGTVVVAADGSEMSCDFVAGADGVRSVVCRGIQERSVSHEKAKELSPLLMAHRSGS